MIVIVYGYEGSGPGHWQRWLCDELTRRGEAVAFPELPEPAAPQRDEWVAALRATIEATRRDGDGTPSPLTFVCHSLGCWALDHLLADGPIAGAHAALLVAPPSPFLVFEPVDSFFPPPRFREAWESIADRTLVVGSDNDAYTAPEEFEEIAHAIGARAHLIPGAGHINVESGHGAWPFVLRWLSSVGALGARDTNA